MTPRIEDRSGEEAGKNAIGATTPRRLYAFEAQATTARALGRFSKVRRVSLRLPAERPRRRRVPAARIPRRAGEALSGPLHARRTEPLRRRDLVHSRSGLAG